MAQVGTLSAQYTPLTTFNTHEGTANPHGTTYTDVGAAASTHSHAISEVTSLQTTLDGKYDEVAAAVTNNFPIFGAGGVLVDSGYDTADLPAFTATKWLTARLMTLSGDVTGTVTFDGSAAINMTNTSVAGLSDRVVIASPTISADMDCNNNALDEVKVVNFNGLYDNGNKSTSWTLAPENGQYQEVTLTGNGTMSITTPVGPTTIYLHVHQDAGGTNVLTLPSGLTVNGSAKANTLTGSARDLLMIHYDGTSYLFEYMLNLS